LRSLAAQSARDIETIVVDNSGAYRVTEEGVACWGARLIRPGGNAGFGGAFNAAFRVTDAPFLATVNDDAVADPNWLEALLSVMEARPDVGMCAPCVLLHGEDRIDSAAMLICADGTSKQRGHGESAGGFKCPEEVLLPSGAAAIYRRAMLEEIGLFDESFFLYCEDTDLGLRARWAGWKCLYVPQAVVEHRYSHSAGRASSLKAYLVERNRISVALKNFTGPQLLGVPFAALTRYFWHMAALIRGSGKAAEFRAAGQSGWMLPWFVLKAHLAVVPHLPHLMRQRRRIRATARLSPREFRRLVRRHSISPRQVATL
jgi:GT2 family glycosyltransferase